MMRSLYSGISGLRNHQTRMDVIGNNIANVNTAGYKTSRVIFQDIFSQNVQSGMANQQNVGGTNPLQVGLGIRLSSVDVIHTRAAFGRTDKETDMMINGDGFFIVAEINPESGAIEPLYTRAGNFIIDEQGYLVTTHGYYVMGYTTDLMMGVVDPGREAVLGQDAVVFPGRSYEVIDDGNGDPVIEIPDESISVNGVLYPPAGTGLQIPVPGTITSTNLGITDPSFDTISITVPGTLTIGDTFTFDAFRIRDQIAGVTGRPPVFGLVPSAAELPDVGAGNLSPIRVKSEVFQSMIWDELLPGEQAAFTAALANLRNIVDAPLFDPIAYQNAQDTLNGIIRGMQANYPQIEVGLPSFGVAKNGDVSVMVNNREVVIGRIAVAMFANPEGLEKAGNSLYREGAASGPAVVTQALNEGAGSIDAGGLEMSNVDLANEFTDMIVTQRGFQANSRIITVSDTMLEELVNLKR